MKIILMWVCLTPSLSNNSFILGSSNKGLRLMFLISEPALEKIFCYSIDSHQIGISVRYNFDFESVNYLLS